MAEAASAEPPIPSDWFDKTTVMMRNLPNKYTQKMLLGEINEAGFSGSFDFVYLPVDPETNANRGYAFLNFKEPGVAWKFRQYFEDRKMNRFNSNKVVKVTPATLQGYDKNYEHYSSKRVNDGDPETRPLFLREGDQPQGESGGGRHLLPPKRRRKPDEQDAKRRRRNDNDLDGDSSATGSVTCSYCGSTVAVHLGMFACSVCRAPCYKR
eukprot:TRINITY_DN107989_c0_g1_i1.p1 TRINITY_DN107989_c0_g1~~TRINITY_DN107989_c0_g1_i1.p1  ORF type:complete len:238 (-),score=27.30 TRINITY_DN107989_c0_g1_i1:299-928(-)